MKWWRDQITAMYSYSIDCQLPRPGSHYSLIRRPRSVDRLVQREYACAGSDSARRCARARIWLSIYMTRAMPV